jgi:two-component system, cell cycle sensor histidine kinase and response regulator CckA
LFVYLHMGLDFRIAAPLGWIACVSFLGVILGTQYEGWLKRDLYSIVEILVANTLVMLNARDHELSNRRFFRANKVVLRQREQEAELQKRLNLASRQEAVGRLAGGVAHDFNNLLQVISGAAQNAMESGPSAGPLADQLRLIHKTAQSGGALSRQLLAFSREGSVSRAPLDLHELIERNTEIFRRVFSSAISIETSLLAPQGWVSGDMGMLEQVLLNLVLNARDAMPDGGKITVSTAIETPTLEFMHVHPGAKAEPYLVMSMADTGTGISPEAIERIFEPFFTTKELGRGAGLGLSSAYGILQLHDGTIDVRSEVGKGTTFRVFLPLLPASEVPQPSVEVDVVPPGTETLLVVEDNPDLCWVLCEMLQSHGYRVISALDGEQGLTAFRENQRAIHLAILDVMLPRMGGYELFGRIRAIRPGLPVIFTSGYTGSALDRPPPGGEKAPLLRKPYKNEILYRLIREQLDGKKG